jgi:hypothetical protein
MAKRGNKRGQIGDITDYVPKKSNGPMNFGQWEDHMGSPVKKQRKQR